MPLPHQSVVFDIDDFKIWPLVDDLPANASPTYGSVIDVPGISNLTIDPNLVTAELDGDSQVLAKKGKIDKIQVGFTHGIMSLDVQKALEGGTITDVASTESKWDFQAGNPLPYFGAAFEMQDVSTDLGINDLHVIIYKCQITGGQLLNPAYQKFSEPTGTFEGYPPQSQIGRTMRVRLLSTVTALAITG